jgi:hypothetical protein
MKRNLILIFILIKLSIFAQSFTSNFKYLGVSMNKYRYGLTPFDIYAYDVNHLSTTSKSIPSLIMHQELYLVELLVKISLKEKLNIHLIQQDPMLNLKK